jgi:hypothetical protein
MDRWFYRDTWNHRGDVLAHAPRLLAHKCFALFAPAAREFPQWPHRLILPFALIGIALTRPRVWYPWLVVCTAVLAHVALGLLFVATPRYRAPIDPFVWLIAAAALVLLWRKGNAGRGAILLIVGLNVVVRLVQ